MSTALVLSGGGARAAYQVGVLRRIAEISVKISPRCPFDILCGASAGAANVAAIASRFYDFHLATQGLYRAWANMLVHHIYRTDVISLLRITSYWAADLGLGAIIGAGKVKSLLDTTPLQNFLKRVLTFDIVREAISNGDLKALAVTATSYSTGKAVTFVDGVPGLKPWSRVRRIGIFQQIDVEHVAASSAIPLLFPAIKVGNEYYGDGSIRFHTPLSPAARLGAKKIIAVGVRHSKVEVPPAASADYSYPSVGQMVAIPLNSLFLDNMDADWENLLRINELLKAGSGVKNLSGRGEAEIISGCLISPSEDIGAIANQYERRLPLTIRYLLRGLGVEKEEGADLTSYLLFHADYTRTLIDLGYHDACAMDDEIELVLSS